MTNPESKPSDAQPMREIKFRVAVKSPHWDAYPASKWLVSTNSFTISEFWEHEVELLFADGGTLPFGDIDWTEDEVRYLQYTGLKDKNGVEIYEGDICEVIGGERAEVKYFTDLNWDSGGSLHPGFWFDFPYMEDRELTYHDSFDGCEVIGDIYQNPELVR